MVQAMPKESEGVSSDNSEEKKTRLQRVFADDSLPPLRAALADVAAWRVNAERIAHSQTNGLLSTAQTDRSRDAFLSLLLSGTLHISRLSALVFSLFAALILLKFKEFKVYLVGLVYLVGRVA